MSYVYLFILDTFRRLHFALQLSTHGEDPENIYGTTELGRYQAFPTISPLSDPKIGMFGTGAISYTAPSLIPSRNSKASVTPHQE